MSTKRVHLILLTLFLLVILIGCNASSKANLLEVHVIDVGQGDSILITTPENKTILIDGGEAKYGSYVVNYLNNQDIDTIDILIATHPHADHIGGLKYVIEEMEIKEIIMPSVAHTSKTFENLLLTIQERDLSITPAKKGLAYQLENNIVLSILSPIKDYGNNLNNWSVVTQLTYGNKTFLFTGDAEYEVEKDLLTTYESLKLKSHFLKIGHHGSNTSTSTEFLAAVKPDVAVIPLGEDNPYGFPHKELIDRLQGQNLFIYRTDFHGNIVFFSDGEEIWTESKPFDYE